MDFRLQDIKRLANEYGTCDPDKFLTNDTWLDNRYREHYELIGIHSRYYRLFFGIADRYRPRFVVELGSWWATAAAHFAAGCPTTDVVTIDAHTEIHPSDSVARLKAYMASCLYDNLQFVPGRIEDESIISKICHSPYPIDILFMDAGHEYESIVQEWELYSPLLADCALVIVDDILYDANAAEDMVTFWEELGYEKFRDVNVHPGFPMGFFKFVRVR